MCLEDSCTSRSRLSSLLSSDSSISRCLEVDSSFCLSWETVVWSCLIKSSLVFFSFSILSIWARDSASIRWCALWEDVSYLFALSTNYVIYLAEGRDICSKLGVFLLELRIQQLQRFDLFALALGSSFSLLNLNKQFGHLLLALRQLVLILFALTRVALALLQQRLLSKSHRTSNETNIIHTSLWRFKLSSKACSSLCKLLVMSTFSSLAILSSVW